MPQMFNVFRSTLLHEERHADRRSYHLQERLCFDPRSCTRSDTRRVSRPSIISTFRSTLLHEVRQANDFGFDCRIVFRSTLLHEERPSWPFR